MSCAMTESCCLDHRPVDGCYSLRCAAQRKAERRERQWLDQMEVVEKKKKGVVFFCVLREFDLSMEDSKTAEMYFAAVNVCIGCSCTLRRHASCM